MNDTELVECYYASYNPISTLLLGLINVPVIVFGLLANILSFRIFTHAAFRYSSINWYICILCVSDFCILGTSFFMLTMPRLGEYTTNYSLIRLSYMGVPVCYGLGILSQTISVYMITLLSLHRCIGVCIPLRARGLLTPTRTCIAIVVVLICSLLFNISRFLEVDVEECFATNINYTIPVVTGSKLRYDATYSMIMHGWSYTLVMFIIPFSTLIITSILVIHIISKARMQRATVSHQSRNAKDKKETKTSTMLLTIVVVFLCCNFLALINNIIEVSGAALASKESFSRMVDTSNFLVTINASINIFVFCSFSEKYRLLVRYYLLCYFTGIRDDANLISIIIRVQNLSNLTTRSSNNLKNYKLIKKSKKTEMQETANI